MILSDTAIKRPVFATMLMVSLLLFGFLGIRGMGIDQFPTVDFPIVTITTVLTGASPEVVESDVTEPIEEQLFTIEGVDKVNSVSMLGMSTITVEFELERDIDIAAQDVRDKVALAKADLPRDAEEPVVQKVDINAQPVVWITMTGGDVKTMSLLADEVIKPRLQTLEGVGNVLIGGSRAREMRIWLDRRALEVRDLTSDDVVRAVQTRSAELPAGSLEGATTEFQVKVQGELSTAEEFGQLVVAYRNGAPVRLRDLGHVEDAVAPNRGVAHFNGVPAVGLGVAPRPGANTVAVAERTKAALEEVRGLLPPGIEADIAFDSSKFIQESIDGAAEELFFGALFAILITFLFLRSWRSTLVIALTIPTSLIATFGAMRVLGFSINNLTMLAMALSVGIVIDDAIIVLENIFHHLERGEDPKAAARVGAAEIAFAAIAATFSIAAVFIPVVLIKGLIGRFLFQFGISVAVAVLFSLLVALTLTPMLSSRMLAHAEKHGRLYRTLERAFEATEGGYRWLLDWALKHRLATLGIGALAFVLAIALVPLVGTEFVPNQDEGRFVVRLQMPVGSSVEYSEVQLTEVDRTLLSDSAVAGVFSAIGLRGGVDAGFAFVNLVDRSERRRTQDEIMAEYREKLNRIPGATVFVERVSIVGGGQRNTPIQLELRGPDIEVLAATARAAVDSLARIPGFVDVDQSLRLDQPEVNLRIDRGVAATQGVDVLSISRTVGTMIGGQRIATYKTGGKRYDVRVQVLPDQRATPEDVSLLPIRTEQGRVVKLANLVHVDEGTSLASVDRSNQERAVTIFANLSEDLALGDALPQALAVVNAVRPPGYTVTVAGQSEQFGDAFGDLLFAFGLSIIVIYILLAIQFEHFVHPVTLMIALPLAATGGLGLMVLTGTRLGIMGMIGMILLMGLVMKNSILLIDLTNQLRERGQGMYEALREACPRRLRPIVMTSMAVIFGVLPVALQISPGSELRAPMAIAVIGGIFTSTALTLFVVPVVYTYLDGLPALLLGAARRVGGIGRRRREAPEGAVPSAGD